MRYIMHNLNFCVILRFDSRGIKFTSESRMSLPTIGLYIDVDFLLIKQIPKEQNVFSKFG